MSACAVCTSPTGDGSLLCNDDTERLVDALYAVGSLMEDLRVAHTRQSNFRGLEKPVGKSTETPLPWDERVTARMSALRNVLVLWAYAVAGSGRTSTPRTVDPRDPARIPAPFDTGVFASRVLHGHIEDIRRHRRAGDAFRDITESVSAARRVIDRPMDRAFLGICSTELENGELCDRDLYAHPHRNVARCAECGAEHDVEQRRETLLSAVHDQLVTYGEAERALPHLLGTAVKVSTLRNWVAEKRLIPEGYRHDGRYSPSKVAYHDAPLLKVGDIVREYTRVAVQAAAA